MKHSVEWDNSEKTIVRMTYAGKWTWKDFYDTNMASVALAQTVEHRIHVIADFRHSQGIPGGNPLIHARNAMAVMPDNWGILVIVTDNQIIGRLVSIFRMTFRRLGQKTFLAANMDEAYRLIAQQDSDSTVG